MRLHIYRVPPGFFATQPCVLTTRFAQYATYPHPHLATPLQALALLKPLMAHLDHEEFRVLVLDAHNRLVDNVLLYRGTINGTQLRTAEVR